MASSPLQPTKPREGAAVLAGSVSVNSEHRCTLRTTTQSAMGTSPTTECASSSYEPPPGVVKPRIRRKSSARPKRKSSPARRLSRIVRQFYDWKNKHHYLGRYSVEKLLAFDEYQQVISPYRVIAVILLTPLPPLLAMILVAAIPLQSPLLGPAENIASFVQSVCLYTLMTFGLLLFIRQSLGWTDSSSGTYYSHRDALLISVLTATTNECCMVMLAFVWRFPVPFRDLLGTGPFFIWFSLYHMLIVGHVLRANRKKLLNYTPLLLCQTSTLFILEAVAILFKNVSAESQVTITLCFPFIKAALKRMVWQNAHHLEDISTDVTVCVVEIFGSLFQNVCIQNVRSQSMGAVIIVIDFLQAVLETKMYLSHRFIVDSKIAVSTVVKIIESALFPGVSKAGQDRRYSTSKPCRDKKAMLSSSTFRTTFRKTSSIILTATTGKKTVSLLALVRDRSRSKVASAGPDNMLDIGSIDPRACTPTNSSSRNSICAPGAASLVYPDTGRDGTAGPGPASAGRSGYKARQKVYVDDITLDHKELAKLLMQTLQLLFASEVLVFVEYVEFMTPVLYGLYSLGLYHLPYAKYSLAFIGMTKASFWASTATTTLYAALEGVSMLLMIHLVKQKYGLSALYQLAFVLENYWMGVQGKLLGSLVLIFNLNTVHHGVDLSLEFNWKKVLNGTAGS